MTEYDIQAAEFLKKANTKMSISMAGEVKGFPFDGKDTLWHYKYLITLTRNKKQYRFTFYDSFYNWQKNKRPSRYDILAGVEKYEVPYRMEDFAAEFGYELYDEWDYRYNKDEYKRIKNIHKACQEQYCRLLDLFGEELMKDLQEIN